MLSRGPSGLLRSSKSGKHRRTYDPWAGTHMSVASAERMTVTLFTVGWR
jgi:hypothetical protein